jgi:hypothetical protein
MNEMKYVVVYRPPQGWDLHQHWRDEIMATGNVLEIRPSSLYSLQFTELHLDSITRRPLGVVLFGMADRYDYRLGGDKKGERGRKWEPFDVFEAKELSQVELYCSHLRPRTYGDWVNVPGRSDGPYPTEDRCELREYMVWEDYRTGEARRSSYRVVASRKGLCDDAVRVKEGK